MINKKIFKLNFGKDYSIVINKTYSPDGVKGMFLLVNKNLINNKKEIIINKKNIYKILTFETTLDNIKDLSNNKLQENFEDFTFNLLSKEFPQLIEKTKKETMNEYDFKINNFKIEVKSDKWKYTGNISLELIRDYNANHKANIGSILKTNSDIWQIYYYDLSDNCVKSEIYETRLLANEVENIFNKIFKNI